MDETFRWLYHKVLKKIYNVIHSIRQDSEHFSRKNLDNVPEPVINPAMGLAPASVSSKVCHENLPRRGLPNATTLVWVFLHFLSHCRIKARTRYAQRGGVTSQWKPRLLRGPGLGDQSCRSVSGKARTWAGYSTFLCHAFLICKWRKSMVPTYGCRED